ncbi:hypothetical protein AAL_06383 [Moelleriella libera RCEF 2490]|uniref:Uncharacterized protein n=1 Tax=Moelleriella libera RCEF 2490 TaxID=1081109 RepID=A0A162IE92_9HYPO|nr:hypothetical protein AAL_06383 [Moelleriella libera RCEF 2490]
MSQWRVSAGQPVREVQGLDHERCAALHNLIVERGWAASGRSLSDLDRRTWWECHGGGSELSPQAAKLSSSVIAFLQTAQHGHALTAQPPHAFFRYHAGLCSPEDLWENANYGEGEDDSNKKRFVTLYMANWALGASHPLGLVLDQQTSMAMQHISINDTSATMNGRQVWLPLELILEGFLDMMDQGKALAVDLSYDGEQERIAPWIMPSFTSRDVDETLQAFDRLKRVVEAHMPEESFAGQFLTRAPEIRFSQVAPGLRVARQQQPFSSSEMEPGKLRPLLLFESGHAAHQDTERTPWGDQVPISPFPRHLDGVTSYPAGLYLTETNPHGAHPFEDGCKLILPFAIGGNGWARTSDGALFGENTHDQAAVARPVPRSTQLYQQGLNRFIKTHDVQLKHVLRHWAGMVEEGKWAVDANGVAGDVQKWKEADTASQWQDYQLPISW